MKILKPRCFSGRYRNFPSFHTEIKYILHGYCCPPCVWCLLMHPRSLSHVLWFPTTSLLYCQHVPGRGEWLSGDGRHCGSWDSGKHRGNTALKGTLRNVGNLLSAGKEIPFGKSLSNKYHDVFVFRLMCKNSRTSCFSHFYLCESVLKSITSFLLLFQIYWSPVPRAPC